MYRLARAALFQLPPEISHSVSLKGIACAERLGLLRSLTAKQPRQPVEVMGLKFDNPFGLAAGLDKNGDYFNSLGALGFGFVEIGTVTPLPQPGNPRPRLFRLPQEQAIINRMGFNNHGVDHLVNKAGKRRYKGVLGINIGKNLTTSIANAQQDYCIGMEKVYPVADYIAINISSPNTPGLRDLQNVDQLDQLLDVLKDSQARLAERHGRYVPLAVKIAPDQSDTALCEIAAVLRDKQIDGVIATNTTVSRQGVENNRYAGEQGGLSGAPLEARATEVIATLARELDGTLPIIGVGGICDGAGATQKLAAGASLVQIYSGFIYRGPALIKDMAAAVAAAS
ncbi:MAG: quinone-dependent dihydroorotate dehydrogenase [Gammaproteobacteria bacterium]|nr:MAG: quinone-dependent dihydroorotate dehydrogenase [Gammaproteobacteria bacterium]RLA49551.1 MAG: quinone-dependent dihydroorotate dehydrogenase [Gammaproteobacteria bacterium]